MRTLIIVLSLLLSTGVYAERFLNCTQRQVKVLILDSYKEQELSKFTVLSFKGRSIALAERSGNKGIFISVKPTRSQSQEAEDDQITRGKICAECGDVKLGFTCITCKKNKKSELADPLHATLKVPLDEMAEENDFVILMEGERMIIKRVKVKPVVE